MGEEMEIDLMDLIEILFRKKWLFIISIIIGGILGYGLTLYMVTPSYESYTTLMVNSSKGSTDSVAGLDISSLNLSQKIVVTYSEIVKSRIVLEPVIERLDLDMSYNGLLSSIRAIPVNDTEILKISVDYDDPETAAMIANTISDVFIKEVIRIMQVYNVEIIDRAIPLYQPTNVHKSMNIMIGAVLGGMVASFIVFLIMLLDRTVKTVDDIEKNLGMPVIGTIVVFDTLLD